MSDQDHSGADAAAVDLAGSIAAPQLSHAARACVCSAPDPVMQADGKFYCHQCSYQTGARPSALEPERWLRELWAADVNYQALLTRIWDIAGTFDHKQCNQIRDEIHMFNLPKFGSGNQVTKEHAATTRRSEAQK